MASVAFRKAILCHPGARTCGVDVSFVVRRPAWRKAFLWTPSGGTMNRCTLARPHPAAALALLIVFVVPTLALASPCTVPNTGGTVQLPPPGCGYVSPTDLH